MHACAYINMYARVHVLMSACMYVYTYACTYACMYTRMQVCAQRHMYPNPRATAGKKENSTVASQGYIFILQIDIRLFFSTKENQCKILCYLIWCVRHIVNTNVLICTHIYICVFTYIRTYTNSVYRNNVGYDVSAIYIYIYIYMCVCIYVYVYVYVYIYI